MGLKLLAVAGVASLFMLAPAVADAACCDQAGHATHEMKADKPCCNEGAKTSAVDVLMGMDPQLNPAPPVRQLADVWFKRPVMVGRSILQGRYVIEHDNDRMARGEPCTHIYAFEDQKKPIVTFHCTHLERDRTKQSIVVVVSTSDPMIQRMTEFQFAGETASHGYPTVR
jgi:hypothetical protein